MEKICIDPPKVEKFINKKEHSEFFIDFVNQCLEINPEKRPTAEMLINHMFITKLAQGCDFLKKLVNDNLNLVEKFKEEEEKIKNNENVYDIDDEENNFDNKYKKFNNEKHIISEEIISFNEKMMIF